MIQAQAVQSQADAHRRELERSAGSRRSARGGRHRLDDPFDDRLDDTRGAQRSATGVPVSGGRAVRRGIAPRVGGWLIEFGTRLGGATVRTS